MNRLRQSFAALAIAASALTAGAQQSQVCFQDTLSTLPTNWMRDVTIPKFDPNLGQLVSIDFELIGTASGSAAVESLDTGPTNTVLQFSSTLTLTRPDMSVLVIALPLATFNDTLAPFDGTIDFDGPSGETHPNITASQSVIVTSPPPDSDLALFTGPAGNPGTIILPVSAVGSSVASGSGNIVSQFMQDASAVVNVCYNYIPAVPPTFQCVGPQMGSVGVPVSFQVCASDTDPNDIVTITATGVPPGATITPPLPASGNPICVTFNWTPGPTDIGVFVIVFTATDMQGNTATCTVNLTTAECFTIFSSGTGNAQVPLFGHLYDTQLHGARMYFPVTMEDNPSFPLRALPAQFYTQVVMYNPMMFPANQSQWSNVLQVINNFDGTITTNLLGTLNGIHVSAQTFTQPSGQVYVRFPFTIDGM